LTEQTHIIQLEN
jgi:hypothetical protein